MRRFILRPDLVDAALTRGEHVILLLIRHCLIPCTQSSDSHDLHEIPRWALIATSIRSYIILCSKSRIFQQLLDLDI